MLHTRPMHPLASVTQFLPRRTVKRVLSSTVSVRTSAPMVALTFDDGPDERLTAAVLDALRERRARATFFVVAGEAERAPALVRRMVAEGHEVALHGDEHVDLSGLPRQAQVRAVRRGRRRLREVTGTAPRWFRPPYGRQTAVTVAACRTAGMQPVLWSTSAHDWEALPVQDKLDHLAPAMKPGAIVLLHDGAAGAGDPPPPSAEEQTELIGGILDLAGEQGLEPVTVGDLHAAGEAVRSPWFRHWLHH